VGEIDQHAEPVHLAHDFPAEVGEAAVTAHVVAGVRPVERDVVRQGHVAHAQVVVGAAARRAIPRWRGRPRCEERGDRPRFRARSTSAAEKAGSSPLGIARDHLAGDVDLLELDLREAPAGEVARDVHGPELPADAALLQPGKIRVAARRPPEVVGGDVPARRRVVPDRPREVVVAVDDRMLGEESPRVAEGGERPE
jgi:hypothetical protein